MSSERLPYLTRYLRVAFAAAILVSSASIANASMSCLWLDEIPRISDPSIQEKLEAHMKALPGLENPEIRQLEEHYFVVQATSKFCKEVPRCEHRLLDLQEGVVKNVFAFRGTGVIWKLWSPLGLWIDELGDDYSFWAFQTTEGTYIRVDLPRFHDMVVISSPGAIAMKTLRVCDNFKR